MTETVPYFSAAIEADKAGEAMPDFFRKDLGFGTAADVAGLVAFLASDAAANISGRAIGVGGDRLQVWSHPEPVATEYRQGGWTYEAMQSEDRELIENNLKDVGEKFMKLQAELQQKD